MAGQTSRRSTIGRVRFDNITPTLLQPLVRAYILGYASSTIPRLLTVLITYASKGAARKDGGKRYSLLSSIERILRGGLELNRFPTFCAALVGASTLLQIPVSTVLKRFASSLSVEARRRLSIWLSSLIAAWFSLKLLQTKESEAFIDRVPPNTYSPSGVALKSIKFAGRTMDLSLFALARAVDVIVGELWARRRLRREAANSWNRVEAILSTVADPTIFAASAAFIMWTWIYTPERLPRSYVKWIDGAAAVDPRLVTALQKVHYGEIVYGQDTGEADLLTSMCKDYKLPLVWGDPAKTFPYPCEIVHMGCGPSCEYHALWRFANGFLMAAGMYGPLNLVLILRNPTRANFIKALQSSLRSSAFLGSFISLFYYGICLCRSRIGPLVLGTDIKTLQSIDSGNCVGAGCVMCGWSIFLENAGKRKDLALFVAPRALATLLPRRYEMKYQWRETAMFAVSTAVVFTCVQENPKRVRGVLGQLLAAVLKPSKS